MTQLTKNITRVLPLLLLTACDHAVDTQMSETAVSGVSPINQSQLNQLANTLEVKYRFFSNIE